MEDKSLLCRQNNFLPSEVKWCFRYAQGLLATVLIGLAFYAHTSPPAGLLLEPVATSLNRPVAVRHAGDGTDRLFVVEQAGKILILNSLGELLETEFFDITGRVEDGSNEQGLLGLAFDPDYESNGYSYVYYIYNVSGGTDWTRVSRFSVSDDDVRILPYFF